MEIIEKIPDENGGVLLFGGDPLKLEATADEGNYVKSLSFNENKFFDSQNNEKIVSTIQEISVPNVWPTVRVAPEKNLEVVPVFDVIKTSSTGTLDVSKIKEIPETATQISFYASEELPDGTDITLEQDGSIILTNINTFYQIYTEAARFKLPESIASLFSNRTTLTKITGLSNFDTSTVKTMNGMFYNSGNLTISDDISTWDVSNVTNMSYMFYSAHKISDNIGDISNWNVSNVYNMSNMFANSNMQYLDLSNWNVSNVKDMSSMFYSYNIGGPRTVGDLSSWNVSKVTNMTKMFMGCTRLSTIGDVSNWDISNVTNMVSMFYGTSIPRPSWYV